MAIEAGTHTLGPDNATLRVHTGRSGAAAAAGHDLTMEVTSWEATLTVGEQSSLELTADATSLSVIEGKGGMKSLTEDDKADIKKSIDKDVLEKKAIHFSSSDVQSDNGTMTVNGDLEIAGTSTPVQFTLSVADDGTLNGSAKLAQSDWNIKPYSALFGALKVNDEVEVSIDGKLPSA
jgi:polyisoprenoid-binding protein YceI